MYIKYGFPFIIKYLDKMDHSDTIITITLPIQYKFISQKIKFEFPELTSQDEKITALIYSIYLSR